MTCAFLGRPFWLSLMKRATRKSFKTNLFVMLIETRFVKRIFPAIQRTNYVIGMSSFSRLISDLAYEKSLWKTFQWKVVCPYYTNNFCKKLFFWKSTYKLQGLKEKSTDRTRRIQGWNAHIFRLNFFEFTFSCLRKVFVDT